MPSHVVIIGGGVIGLSTAYYCAERGLRVTVIERGGPARDGCSYGNAGMIVPSHFVPLAAPGMVALGLKWMWNPESPFYIQPRISPDLWRWCWQFWRSSTPAHVARSAPLLRDLHLASRTLYEGLAHEWNNEFGLQPHGLLLLCKTAAALHEEAHMAEQARALGIPAEVVDAAGAAALDPAVRMDIHGAVYYPRDAHLSPQNLMAGLQRRLIERGVDFRWQTEVTGLERQGRRITGLQTRQGPLAADEVVLAGGAWSPELTQGLGLALPMQAGKGYSLTLLKPRQLPRLCAIFTEARVAVTPLDGALRFGGTMALSGLNETIQPARVRGIIRAVSQYYPEFQSADFAEIAPWRGLRPCSPDGLPYLGRTRRFDNLTLATGHAMMGVSLAPITGQLVAEQLTGATSSIDCTLLSPDRFG